MRENQLPKLHKFSVNNVGEVGVIFPEDQQPHDLPPNAWTWALNCRIQAGYVEAARGWKKRLTLPYRPQRIDHCNAPTNLYWLSYSLNRIHTVAGSGLTVTEVTKTSGAYTNGLWVTDNFQGIPIATNGQDLPQAQFVSGSPPDNTTDFIDMPTWPATDTCEVIAAYRNFIVTANLTEDGDHYPTKVRWSDAAAPGDLPPSWDVADPTTLAGEIVLEGDLGAIVAMMPLRDDLIIYTRSGAWRMTFTGGPYVMQVRKITEAVGAFGPYSVVNVGGAHVVLTRDDLVIFDGSQVSSIADRRARRTAKLGLLEAAPGDVRLAYYPEFKEIWIGLGVASPKRIDRLATVCIDGGGARWAQRDVPALVDFKVLADIESVSAISANLSYAEIGNLDQIDGYNKVGTATYDNPTIKALEEDLFLFGADLDGNFYHMDYGELHEGRDRLDVVLERTDLNITGDEATSIVLNVYPHVTAEQVPQVPAQRSYVDMESYPDDDAYDSTFAADKAYADLYDGREPVRIHIGTQEAAGAPIDYRAGDEWDTTRYKTTVKARGRRHAFKLTSHEIPWRITGYDLEYTVTGRR